MKAIQVYFAVLFTIALASLCPADPNPQPGWFRLLTAQNLFDLGYRGLGQLHHMC